MKLRHLLLGAGLGICTAVVVRQYVMKPYISSEKALRIVKSAFKQRGPIDGSWIYTQPEPYNINGRNGTGIQNRHYTISFRRIRTV